MQKSPKKVRNASFHGRKCGFLKIRSLFPGDAMLRLRGLYWDGLVLGLVLSGCRFYGYPEGVSLTLQQIEALNEQATAMLQEALAEAEALRLLMDRYPELSPYQAQYEAVLQAHQKMLFTFGQWMQAVKAHPKDYRRAQRTLGAISANLAVLTDHYAHVAEAVAQHVETSQQVATGVSVGPRYFFAVLPPQYARLQNVKTTPPLQRLRKLVQQQLERLALSRH